MRKLIRLIIGFMLLGTLLHPLSAQQFTGGLNLGLTASQVDGDTYKGYNKVGVSAGGWVNITFGRHSAFQTGLNYIQKGSRRNPDYEKEDYNSLLIRLGYVEMPLLYQYRLKSGIFLETGTSIGVLLHSFEEVNGLPSLSNPFRVMDFSFQAGIGYQMNEKWKIGIRSGNSLVSIRKERVTGDRRRIWGYGQYNSVLDIELAFKL